MAASILKFMNRHTITPNTYYIRRFIYCNILAAIRCDFSLQALVKSESFNSNAEYFRGVR